MPIKHIILAILVAAVWGLNFIFVKLGVKEVPPLFLCAVRFFFAAVPAVFFVKWPRASFKLVALYGFFMFALQFALIFTGLSVGMTAGLASLLIQSQMFFSVFFAFVIFGERPKQLELIGIFIAFAGILFIALQKQAGVTLTGVFFVISGAAAWSVGNLITRKMGNVNKLGLIVWGSLLACLPLLGFSLFIEGSQNINNSLSHLSWTTLISLAYIVYGSTWVGYGIWSWLLGRYPVSSIVPFTLLVPVFGILSSILLLGESFGPWELGAAGIILLGLVINVLGPKLFAKAQPPLVTPETPNQA